MADFRKSTPGKAVLVTGCSSGIGRAIALHLARHGFTVFATVRKEADAANLRNMNEPNLLPVCPLDLSRPEEVSAAVTKIGEELDSRGHDGLYAIVNNAGGGEVAPIELMNLDKFRVELEARIVGPIALLQAFLPLLRKARGRVLWIVTPALLPIPYVSSIHTCDFAVNCIARTLQVELKPWRIPVVMIRCGGIKTSAPQKNARDLEEDFRQWPRERFDLYREALTAEQARLAEFDAKRSEPDEVARVVYTALQVEKPRRRYQVGYLAGVAGSLEGLPQPVVDSIMERRATT